MNIHVKKTIIIIVIYHSDYSEPSEQHEQSNENIATGGVFMHGKGLNASPEQHLFDDLEMYVKRKFILFLGFEEETFAPCLCQC